MEIVVIFNFYGDIHMMNGPKTRVTRGKKFPDGNTLVISNQWTGWYSTEIKSFLVDISFWEIKHYEDSEVWLEVDRLNPHGNVYGCILVKISDVNVTDENSIKLSFSSPTYKGYLVTKQGKPTGLFNLKNKSQVCRFLKKYPLAQCTSSV